jgi:cardiolipin synthase
MGSAGMPPPMGRRRAAGTDVMSTLLPRALADKAFSRAAGAPLIEGNCVRLLTDAEENYPAWLEAIAAARRTVHFESYIIHDDDVGHRFAEALIAKAREGVRVRLIYDWLGGLGKASRRFWRGLRAGGVEVRCYNPPRLDSAFGWVSRDHRKMLAVDGGVGFVTGLCVGRMWVGSPARGVEPWRDTGIEVRGPAVPEMERAFAQMWASLGAPIPEEDAPPAAPPTGDTALRVVASLPGTAALFRVDQLVAALARRRLWLTDAYFAGITAYVQALRAAALDGVDVRLLVPGGTDIPVLRPLSRAGYRPLLTAGVRVFEWNGPMLHAKTAVADSMWARVGSTNLNVASWLGNCELDVVIEDERFARVMEERYLQDVENATEIVLVARRQRVAGRRPRSRRVAVGAGASGSAGRAAAGALRIGHTVGAAFTSQRVLEPIEARILLLAGAALLLLAMVGVLFPRVLAYPLGVLGGWIALTLVYRGFALRSGRTKIEASERQLDERP